MTFPSRLSRHLLAASLLSASAAVAYEGTDRDPYALIERQKLANGLVVYWAPGDEAPTAQIRVEVDAGWSAEKAPDWGVAHLLEHNLFRDKQLKDDMSYLQMIREAGGQANGQTERRETSYFGSIPSAKAPWLLEKFSKMILDPDFSETYLEKEKGTVELEIGRPSPIILALGFSPLDVLFPRDFWKSLSFWRTEFGVSYDQPFTAAEEQLANRRLTLKHIKSFYENFYYPANMRLFVSGKFDRREMGRIVENQWAPRPAREGLRLEPKPSPRPRRQPYVRTQVNNLNSSVAIGTKVWGASSRDDIVLDAYVEYLAHRLMKEIRNKNGQTYTASGITGIYDGYGYATVNFETQREHLEKNLALVREHLRSEATAGALTAEQVKECLDLYLAKYHLMGKDAGTLMRLARDYQSQMETYGTFSSPYKDLAAITVGDFNATLKKYFQPQQSYEVVYRPPLLFPYDQQLFGLLVLIAAFMLLRRVLTAPFDHDRVRWVRKLRYPPVRAIETLSLLAALLIFARAYRLIAPLLVDSNFLQGNLFLCDYLLPAFSTFVALSLFQGALSILPRKMMVVGDQLVVKSVSYFSKSLPLAEIKSVQAVRPFAALRFLPKIGFRYFYFNPLFWQKGLLIELRNGRCCYFSVSPADTAKAELERFVPSDRAGENALANVVTLRKPSNGLNP